MSHHHAHVAHLRYSDVFQRGQIVVACGFNFLCIWTQHIIVQHNLLELRAVPPNRGGHAGKRLLFQGMTQAT